MPTETYLFQRESLEENLIPIFCARTSGSHLHPVSCSLSKTFLAPCLWGYGMRLSKCMYGSMRLPPASCIQSWPTLSKHDLVKLPPSVSFTCLIRETRALTHGGDLVTLYRALESWAIRREDGFSVIVHIIFRFFICIYRFQLPGKSGSSENLTGQFPSRASEH